MFDNPTTLPAGAVTAPYAVDTTRGERIGTVSSQWFTRPDDQKFLDLESLYASTFARAESSRAEIIDAKEIRLVATRDDALGLQLQLPTGETAKPSHWSFQQLCSLVKAPAGYLRNKPAMITAIALQDDLRSYREEKVKSYTTGEGSELRALTGQDYGRIHDHELVHAVRRIAREGGWKVPGVMNWATGMYDPNVPVTLDTTTLYASDRDVFLFMVDDLNPIEVGKLADGRPDLMFRGFYGWNSEVGSKSLGIASFYLRAVCANRNLWGCEGFQEIRVVHSKFAADKFAAEAMPALESFSRHDPGKVINGVKAAKEAIVARNKDERIEFLGKQDISKKAAGEIIDMVLREEGHEPESVWDMVNGITAHARSIPHQDDRVTLERVGKRLLDKVTA